MWVLATPADGYTFAMLANGIIIDQVLKKGADFDIRKDLIPVARAVQAPMGVFVSNTLPVNSVKELVEYARKNPGKINYASSGVGSVGQLLTERFRLATGLSLVHDPYPGGNATISVALMAGDVQVSFSDIGSMRALANDKKIKYPATLADQRSPIFPDAPAISEVGIPELRGQGGGNRSRCEDHDGVAPLIAAPNPRITTRPASAPSSRLRPAGPADSRICSGCVSPSRGFSRGHFHAVSNLWTRSCAPG